MGFSSKRGRPRLNRPSKDTGTKELARRHAKDATLEALDICFKRQLISEEEHNAGMHLRWLYTLRFGAPTIAAYDHSAVRGVVHKSDNESWRLNRENEYEQAITLLKAVDAHILVTNVAIFNRFPRFLLPQTREATGTREALLQASRMQERAIFREGLALLHKAFGEMRYRRRK